MAETLIFYPSPGMGHLISMVEFGKLMLTHHPSFSITIIIVNAPYFTGSTADYIAEVSSATPSLTFHHLPTVTARTAAGGFEELSYELPGLNNPNLHTALKNLSQTSKIKALLFDFFNDAAMEVAEKLNIPTYYFFTSGASCLAIFLYFPVLDKVTDKNFKDVDINLEIPGSPTISSKNMADALLVRDTKVYRSFLNTAMTMPKSNGIIMNTFKAFERRALHALSEGLCVIGRPTPPVFPVGPLIAKNGQTGGGHECLPWLDSQPSKSVVLLCFGSMGKFSAEQLKAMADGLERSGHRFLWAVRSPCAGTQSAHNVLPLPEPNLEELFPEGFLQRTKDRGLVVKSWVPQVAVLSHDSVGGFVTHCGWNSVLEAICAGVPMVAWPLYAEQKINRAIIVEELKVSLALNESENGFVSSAELEERVKELMESERGRGVRETVETLRDEAAAALKGDGSSVAALAELAEQFKQNPHESV